MNIIFLTHWFPPFNEIGAVRPYELARFLAGAGHHVSVVTSSGNWSPQTYKADVSGFDVVWVEIPSLMRYADSPKPNFAKRLIKRFFYPDPWILMRRNLLSTAKGAFGGKVDLVISSGLPFSTHVVARDLSLHFGVPWIADNRDLWADTPYRRQFFGSQYLDLLYERSVLKKATSCLVIGEGMLKELRRRLPGMKVDLLMNGADCSPAEYVHSDYRGDEISFVYTGTLYKGRRDVSPLLNALVQERKSVMYFYGAESEYVEAYAQRFASVKIKNGGRVGKDEIKNIQKKASFLVLALGTDVFEKTVLTGKFFEYLETGRPIIALCDQDSELGILVKRYRLGCASRNSAEISRFVKEVVDGNDWRGVVPQDLTRRYQMERVLLPAIDSAFL